MSKEIPDRRRREFIGASLAAVTGAAVLSSELLASGKASAQTKTADSGKGTNGHWLSKQKRNTD